MKYNMIHNLGPVFTAYRYIFEKALNNEVTLSEVNFWTGNAAGQLAKDSLKVDWNDFTYSQLIELGFIRYNDTLLLPNIGHLLLTKVGTKFKAITGEELIYNGNNINTDVRNNMLGFGIECDETIIDGYFTCGLAGMLIDGITDKAILLEGFYCDSYLDYNKETKMIELHIGKHDVILGTELHFTYNHIIDKVIPSNLVGGGTHYSKHRIKIVRGDK